MEDEGEEEESKKKEYLFFHTLQDISYSDTYVQVSW